MANLPYPMFAAYWIPAVGIGEDSNKQWVKVPLTEMLKYRFRNGKAQTGVVFLAFARFNLPPEPFNPKCVKIDQAVLDQIGTVKQLQQAGAKVLLSIVGDGTKLGWHSIPYGQGSQKFNNMINFAQWVTGLIQQYGLDGIDIDDEFDGAPHEPEDAQRFMDTVGILKHYLAVNGKLLTKALWADSQYFAITVGSDAPYNAGAKLGSLLDLGCTMGYGWDYDQQISELERYRDTYQMGGGKVCIGVLAGNAGWYTPVDRVSRLVNWVANDHSSFRAAGMMLWTFSQDIQQFTHNPQNDPKYKYPHKPPPPPPDHEWQKAIAEGLWGIGDWKVLDD